MFIVTKEIDSENISKLCRTCLREDGDKMVCLFVGPAGSSLAAKLRSLSYLEVWQGDGLPEKMCDRCVTRAESALLYREQCRAADRALRQAALKVSGLASYTTVSGCKLYQQNQGFLPVQNCQKTLKCTECGAVFMNYQELYSHRRLHVPFQQESAPVQNMHIVESQNPYLNFSHINATNPVQNASLLRPSEVPIHNENSTRAACALHCSLCNHTFTNRTQLISHNITHNSENLDLSSSCDNELESQNSDQIVQNLSYNRSSRSMENLSYNHDDSDELHSFTGHIDLSGTNSDRMETTGMHSESDLSLRQDLSFSEDHKSSMQYKKHKCDICSKLFYQKSKLVTHRFSHTGEQPFKCQHCDKAYSSKSKLNAHIRLHTKTNVHRCKICDKIFTYPSYLEDHLKTHHPTPKEPIPTKNFECPTCKKRFRLEKNLKSHAKLHSGKGVYQCEVCDKQFPEKYNLEVHLKFHKKVKTHKCEHCEKSFVQKSNLIEHLRVHTKVKPFTCKLCDKSFSQSSHLKSHQVSHNSLRQHQCRLCGKRFKLSSHLKRHLNLHTGTKMFKCDQCSQMFSQAFSLKRHLKRHSESHV